MPCSTLLHQEHTTLLHYNITHIMSESYRCSWWHNPALQVSQTETAAASLCSQEEGPPQTSSANNLPPDSLLQTAGMNQPAGRRGASLYSVPCGTAYQRTFSSLSETSLPVLVFIKKFMTLHSVSKPTSVNNKIRAWCKVVEGMASPWEAGPLCGSDALLWALSPERTFSREISLDR